LRKKLLKSEEKAEKAEKKLLETEDRQESLAKSMEEEKANALQEMSR